MQISEVKSLADSLRAQIGKAIVGQADTIDLMLTALFCGGHILLEGPPGTAKTLLAQSFSAAVNLDFGRIQFTPDLMPGDIVGTNLFNFQTSTFTVNRGPIFCEVLLADEINRTPPKTQAALLEAMQERRVTLDGKAYPLSDRFMVIATENPIEQQGTYPLPEAQLDRFLLQIDIGYPDKEAERRMLVATTFGEEATPTSVCTAQDLMLAQQIVRHIPVGEKVVESILKLVRAARPGEDGAKDVRDAIAWGPGPRASQAFMLAVRARALIEGRLAPSTDDVEALAQPVLRHRMALTFPARAEGLTVTSVIERLCRSYL